MTTEKEYRLTALLRGEEQRYRELKLKYDKLDMQAVRQREKYKKLTKKYNSARFLNGKNAAMKRAIKKLVN
jgi:hypothetical protein